MSATDWPGPFDVLATCGWRPRKARGWIRWDSPSGMVRIRHEAAPRRMWTPTSIMVSLGGEALHVRINVRWAVDGGRGPILAARYYDGPDAVGAERYMLRLALRAERLLPRWAKVPR